MELQELIKFCEDTRCPFAEHKIDDTTFYRVFNSNNDEHLLKWHWDEEDRKVEVMNDTDWKFQFDNQIPFQMKKGDIIDIKKGEFHRVIKGDGILVVKIKKYFTNI